MQFSSLSRDRNEPRKRWSQLKQVLCGVDSRLVDISWIIRFFLGFVSRILGLFEAPMEYLDGMDAQRFQYEQRISGSDTHPAATHLFEMGDKCLNYGGIRWQGWCHPPLFPGTSCKSPNGHRTFRNAENVIGNDVAWGTLPLAVSRQIPTKPLTFCWVGGSIPGINQANQNQPWSIHWEIHECCASWASRCETLNRLVYNSRRAVRETLTQLNGGAEVQERSSGVFETAF